MEPNLRLIHQAWLFALGYGVLLILMVYCANAVKNPVVAVRRAAMSRPGSTTRRPPWRGNSAG